jgi:ferredoxin-NADP reductase
MDHTVKIISITSITHNVKQFDVEKPKGFKYTPGQAIDLTINKPDWKDKKNPFTFTGLNDDDHLQFIIKAYPDSEEGVTQYLHQLQSDDELIISDAWGAIEYKGPGYFIAGGAGITPFIAIFRELFVDGGIEGNTLFFSNKTDKDIILASELKRMLGENALFTTTDDDTDGDHRRIDEAFLKAEVKDFTKHFYVCGPELMVEQLTETLKKLGAEADSMVFER